MSITRQQIINAFEQNLQNHPDVFAFWLEGADANGTVDEYSDLDIWLDVMDGKMPAIFATITTFLTQLSPIDTTYDVHGNDIIHHKIFHLQDSSEFLILDVCLQAHSRDFTFIQNDAIEQPKIIFDKADVVRFVPANEKELHQTQQQRLALLRKQFTHKGVRKYIARGKFLEAFSHYQNHVLRPLIEVLRMKHTPLHPAYGLVHISRHLPPEIISKLESLHQITSFADLQWSIAEAESLFWATVHTLSAKFSKD